MISANLQDCDDVRMTPLLASSPSQSLPVCEDAGSLLEETSRLRVRGEDTGDAACPLGMYVDQDIAAPEDHAIIECLVDSRLRRETKENLQWHST